MPTDQLRALADSVGATVYNKPPPLTLPPIPSNAVASPAAVEETREWLAQRRKAKPEYRDPEEGFSSLFRTKSSIKKKQDTTRWQYSQDELDPALQDAFDESLHAARYASLLELGAKPRFKESLRAATTESASSVVLLLLHHDQKGLANRKRVLSQSLSNALSAWTVRHEACLNSDQLVILKALLACGADATADHLNRAVTASKPGIAKLLLRAVAPPPTTSVSGNLERAVRLGDYDTLSVLLAYEGDPGTDNAQCLLTAIAKRELRFAAALLANQSGSLGAAQLTTCLEAVLSGIPPREQLTWLQLFFAAEARGVPRTLAQRLLRAIRDNDEVCVDLLVAHDAPTTFQGSSALELAILLREPSILEKLLANADGVAIGDALPLAHENFTGREREDISLAMLGAGATGDGVQTTFALFIRDLIATIGSNPPPPKTLQHINAFISGGISVDRDDGFALQQAFVAQNLDVVRLLSRLEPSQDTTSTVLAQIYAGGKPNAIAYRVDIIDCILQCGADESVLRQILRSALEIDWNNEALVNTLLTRGADVNDADGRIVTAAFEHCSTSMFENIVSRGSVSAETTGKCLAGCLSDLAKADALLKSARSQHVLDQALVDEMHRQSTRYDVIEFLLRHQASVDVSSGEALMRACRNADNRALEMLGVRASPGTIDRALRALAAGEFTGRVAVARSLLNAGPSDTAVNEVLVDCIRRTGSGDASRNNIAAQRGFDSTRGNDEALVHLLLRHGPGPIREQGRGVAMRLAIDLNDLGYLRILVAGEIPPETIEQSFSHARSAVQDDVTAYKVFALLLSPEAARPAELSAALMDISESRSENTALWMLLLNKTARLDTVPARAALVAALHKAVGNRDVELVRLILKYYRPLTAASIKTVCLAATNGDHVVLLALLEHASVPGTASRAFEAMTTENTVHSKGTGGLACAKALLEAGVAQTGRNQALALLVEDADGEHYYRPYLDLLLTHSASVNASGGRCLQTTAAKGNRDLFLHLILQGDADSQSVTQALPFLFLSSTLEESMCEILRVCFAGDAQPIISAGNSAASAQPMTYLSLTHRPSGSLLLRTLLSLGYDLQWSRNVSLQPELAEERVNPLLWALSREEVVVIETEVLQVMLEDGEVDVNFTTRLGGISALMIAASNSRLSVMQLLLQHGADASIADRKGRTAVFYASTNGCAEGVRLLAKEARNLDDGSVHEAARELEPETVTFLLEAGAAPDFPSTYHAGRSALLEVLLNARATNGDRRRRLLLILKALLSAGSDPKLEQNSKNALYTVLANDQPLEVLDAYLATDQWGQLNADHNLYRSGRFMYSATMYLQKGIGGSPNHLEHLQRLLRIKRCQDRYFAVEGAQPPDACGVPKDLQVKEDLRKARIAEQQFLMQLGRSKHLQELEFQQESHAMTLQQQRERNTEQLNATNAERTLTIQHASQLALQKQAERKHERAEEVAHKQKLIEQSHAETEHDFELRRRFMREQEGADERRHTRQIQGIKIAEDAQRRLLEAQRNVLPQMRVAYDDDLPD